MTFFRIEIYRGFSRRIVSCELVHLNVFSRESQRSMRTQVYSFFFRAPLTLSCTEIDNDFSVANICRDRSKTVSRARGLLVISF